MRIQPILMREDGNGLHSELMGGSEHSDCDFTSVGNEDLLEWTSGVVCYCPSDASNCACWMGSLEARGCTESTSRCSWLRVAGCDRRMRIVSLLSEIEM